MMVVLIHHTKKRYTVTHGLVSCCVSPACSELHQKSVPFSVPPTTAPTKPVGVSRLAQDINPCWLLNREPTTNCICWNS